MPRDEERTRTAGALARRHWPLAVVLAAGAVLRLAVIVAYDPVFWFTDTGRYLYFAALVQPDSIRPWGYSGFLWLTQHVLDERGVVVLQHLLTLGLVAALYAFLVHRRVRPWLAALAVVPLALSPLVVNIEHHILSDSLFVVLITAAVLLLVWWDGRPPVWACAVAGLVFAVATDTREVALALVPLVLLYLVLRRSGWLRVATFAVAAAVPVLAYLSWMQSTYGLYSFSTWSGKMLYARVAPIAECDRLGALTVRQRELCDPRPPSARPGPNDYLWTRGHGPQRHLPDKVVLSFARRVITHQPATYVRMVAHDTAYAFAYGQRQWPRAACVEYWTYPDPLPGGCRTDAVGSKIWAEHPFKVDRPLAHDLNVYDGVDAPIGPLLLACVLAIGLAIVVRPRAGGWRARLDAAFLAALGLGLTIAAIATAMFSYRYTLPLYSTVPVAAALAATQLARVIPRGARAPRRASLAARR
jgi:4-amino-4-deoxy-L-arabinose transferase-like glycosyltransferase